MGYIKHNAIVITSWDGKLLAQAVAKAKELGATVLGPSHGETNGYASALVCPDGSKEGWEESSAGDARRDALVKWLESTPYEDGSGYLHWVEVRYGGDDPEDAEIVRHYGQEPASRPQRERGRR
jgi:hypothetical protein